MYLILLSIHTVPEHLNVFKNDVILTIVHPVLVTFKHSKTYINHLHIVCAICVFHRTFIFSIVRIIGGVK